MIRVTIKFFQNLKLSLSYILQTSTTSVVMSRTALPGPASKLISKTGISERGYAYTHLPSFRARAAGKNERRRASNLPIDDVNARPGVKQNHYRRRQHATVNVAFLLFSQTHKLLFAARNRGTRQKRKRKGARFLP